MLMMIIVPTLSEIANFNMIYFTLSKVYNDGICIKSGGAIVLGKLPVPGRPTNLD